MTNSLTNINWSDPMAIGIIVGIVAVLAAGGYSYWAWSEKKWPFNR